MKTLTIRIKESHLLRKLDELHLSCRKNTDSGLIKHLILTYNSLELREIESNARIDELERELESEVEKRELFSEALSNYVE